MTCEKSTAADQNKVKSIHSSYLHDATQRATKCSDLIIFRFHSQTKEEPFYSLKFSIIVLYMRHLLKTCCSQFQQMASHG